MEMQKSRKYFFEFEKKWFIEVKKSHQRKLKFGTHRFAGRHQLNELLVDHSL